MKKIQLLLLAFIIGIVSVKANPVDANAAQKVAENFYATTYSSGTPNLSLAYTERDANGVPVYYVFNVNAATKGFVIVTAEDAAHPIIGYSDEGSFVIPSSGNNVGFWLKKSKEQVVAMRAHNIVATSDIADEWTSYSSNTKRATHNAAVVSVGALCPSLWNQSPFYNAYCPDSSVTGCVATAMAQIMKYWQYPSIGTGSSCYDDEQPYFSESYGQLCAEYDTSHYVWSAMPNYPLGQNNDQIAKLMYDCGVSVDMDYTPTESGAEVIGGGTSAFNAYTTYFGYDQSTINVAYYSNYTDSTWIALLENELNQGRPMQFEGFDPSAGGHSWVCDGYYGPLGTVHMNWGWGGFDNGYYATTALSPSPFDFTYGIATIYGIQPPPGGSPTAVNQVSGNISAITVYPNPSHGVFNFTMTNNKNIYQVRVYDVLGQQVNTAIISSANNQINLSTQPKGVYIYKLMTESGSPVSTGRLVIE